MKILYELSYLFYSLLFIEGIYFTCKLFVRKIGLSQKFILLFFVNLILIVALVLYCLSLLGVNTKIIIYSISVIFIILACKSFSIKIGNLCLVKNATNFIFIFTIFIFFIASTVPVTDADSIRYHLGQFNNYSYNSDVYDLHSKISFIGDSLNKISHEFQVYNLTSVLNFYSLFRVYQVLSKGLVANLKLLIFLLLFGSPILLSLFISQKPFLYVVYIFGYLFFLIEKSSKKEINKIIFYIFPAITLLGITKINFIFYALVAIIFLSFKKIKLKNFSKAAFFSFVLFLPFALVNTYVYNDPLGFFYSYYFNATNLSPQELEFVNYALNKNLIQNLSISAYAYFIVGLIFPHNYFQFFTVSIGFGLLVMLLKINFLKFSNYYILVVSFLCFNFFTNRLSVELVHGRDYLIIYILFVLIIRDLFEKKFIFEKIYFAPIFLQFAITFCSLLLYVGSFLFLGGSENLAYHYKNEQFLNKRYKNKDNLVISTIDGNLFKKYHFLNADALNHGIAKSFFINELPDLNKKFKTITLLIRIDDHIPIWLYFSEEELISSTILELNTVTRNPLSKKKINQYFELVFKL